MDVLLLIDRFEDMIRDGASARLGAQVRLDREAVFELVDEMRSTIPDEIRHARWIGSAREEMLAEARHEAERIVAEARAERSRLLAAEEVRPKAEQRAEKILEGGRARARQIRLGAEGYADEILGGLETGFVKLLAATGQASCPGSNRRARWNSNGRSPVSLAASKGSSTKTW